MKKILCIALLLCISHVKSQTYVLIPDANFVTYLQSIVPAAMHNDSLDISNTLVTTSTHTINVRAKSISNLTGVQYFTSLTYLDCSQNNINALPGLASSLKTLWCSNNSISVLPSLSNSLNYLFCDTNIISALPTLPTLLRSLTCGFNQLSSLPAFPSSLQAVYCCGNTISSLPALPSSLYYLNCTGNSLSSFPASIPNGMIYLYLGNNYLTALPSVLPNGIKYFSCDYNNLTTLPAALPTSLVFFICFNNQIVNMPALPGTLTYFDCSSNQINCFTAFPNSITTFNIDPNPYNCLPNYISAMNATDLAKPLCTAGNTYGCTVAAGINRLADITNEINIYPNPAQNNFTIETTLTDKQSVKIVDINGRLVLQQTISTKTNIDISRLVEGIYNVSILSTEGISNKRLIIIK